MRTLGSVRVLFVSSLLTSAATAAPLIYAGNEITFTKTPFSDYTLSANQDFILYDRLNYLHAAITSANSCWLTSFGFSRLA
jgi:hypothetical protein